MKREAHRAQTDATCTVKEPSGLDEPY